MKNIIYYLIPRYLTICLIVSLIILPAALNSQDNPCLISTEAIKEASAIRGLAIKEKTPCYLRNKEEVKEFLLSTIKTKIPAERMKAEEMIYKAFGFIPPDYDYENGLVKLYLDQLGGYYDPDKDHFVMAAWIPAVMQVPVAVHELTHALQDQYYDLTKFTDIKTYSSDQLLARSSLIEGDATAVMVDYTRKLSGQPSISKDQDVTSIMMQNIIGSSLFAGLREVPESLKLTLLFPYTSGLRFAHKLLRDGGYKAIDKAFKNPPRSTEEILHPEKYLSKESDFIVIAPESPKIIEGETSTMVFDDTLGEFAIVSLFSMFDQPKSKASEIAAGWGGDRVAVWKVVGSASKERYEIIWRTHWDTEVDAQEFYEGYRAQKAKAPNVEIVKDPKDVTLVWRSH